MVPPESRPPIAAMWVSDSSVDPALDPRGRGFAPASPERLAAFARAGGLTEVHLHAPVVGAGDRPVDAWLRDAVAALHAAGVRVSAVTDARGATAAWAVAVAGLGPVERLQVTVEPWTPDRHGPTSADLRAAVLDGLAALRGAGTGLPVDATVPWWLCGGPAEASGWTGALAAAADRLVLAAPAARAEGPDGVLDLAEPAVRALVAAGRPFLVGVTADAPAVAGGAHRTFGEEGPVALLRESALVTGALAATPGFVGVAVRSHRSWRRVLGV